MKQFLKQHKYHLSILTVLLIIVCISGYQSFKILNSKFQIITATAGSRLYGTNKIQNPNEQTATISPYHFNTTSQTLNNPAAKPANNSTTTTPVHSATSSPQPPITSYELRVNNTSTVYEAMKNSQLNFKTKTFPGMGYFVEEINGIKNNNQTGMYWIYYVNGESAKLGISQQIVKPNDIITWKYETTNF